MTATHYYLLALGIALFPLGPAFTESRSPVSVVKGSEGEVKEKEWCTPGNCDAWGREYSCGMIKCESASSCGCDCVSTNGSAFYPKAYCGDSSPYTKKNWAYYEKRMLKDKSYTQPAFGL